MASVVFRGRYTDEQVIENELRKFFPIANIRVTFERGRFYCKIPQALTEEQKQGVLDAIEVDHYTRDSYQ